MATQEEANATASSHPRRQAASTPRSGTRGATALANRLRCLPRPAYHMMENATPPTIKSTSRAMAIREDIGANPWEHYGSGRFPTPLRSAPFYAP